MRLLPVLIVASFAVAVVVLASGDNDAPTAGASFPGANGKIAFSSDRAGNHEIYVMDSGGDNITRLTFFEGSDLAPAWSPDGTKIAFERREGDSEYIWVMDANGGNQHRVTLFGDEESPTWSPDGRISYESRRMGDDDLFVIDVDGTDEEALTFTTENEGDPSWSPDGSLIAFTREGDVWSMPTCCGIVLLTNLTNDPTGGDFDPDWSPDSQHIAFTSNRGPDVDVWVMDRDGDNQEQVTIQPTSEGNPTWSPDGTKIAYHYQVGSNTGQIDVYVMNPDGSEPAELTSSESDEREPAWGVQPAGTATPTPTLAPTVTPTPTATTPWTATPAPTQTPPSGVHTWGNLDCDLDGVTSRDNQALLREVLSQIPLSQTEPCFGLDDPVDIEGFPQQLWADLDCDGEISSRDNQALLRHVLTQAALSQTDPCPDIGAEVSVTGSE